MPADKIVHTVKLDPYYQKAAVQLRPFEDPSKTGTLSFSYEPKRLTYKGVVKTAEEREIDLSTFEVHGFGMKAPVGVKDGRPVIAESRYVPAEVAQRDQYSRNKDTFTAFSVKPRSADDREEVELNFTLAAGRRNDGMSPLTTTEFNTWGVQPFLIGTIKGAAPQDEVHVYLTETSRDGHFRDPATAVID